MFLADSMYLRNYVFALIIFFLNIIEIRNRQKKKEKQEEKMEKKHKMK